MSLDKTSLRLDFYRGLAAGGGLHRISRPDRVVGRRIEDHRIVITATTTNASFYFSHTLEGLSSRYGLQILQSWELAMM